MQGPFESVTRVAIDEIIREHGESSKFGLFFTDEKIKAVVDDMFQLLLTSRTLKSAGDKMLAGGIDTGPPQGAVSRPPR